MKNNTKAKNRRQQTAKHQQGDLFTMICHSDLGVACIKEFKFHPIRRWRFDYAIPTHKIAIEVEGGVWIQGRHTRPRGFLGDMEKYNTAASMGWRVLRTTPSDLHKRSTLRLVKMTIDNCCEVVAPVL